MTNATRPGNREELLNFFAHLEVALDEVGYFKTAEKRPAMVRTIRNLFARADLTEQEIRTLHGIVKELKEGRARSTERGGGPRKARASFPKKRIRRHQGRVPSARASLAAGQDLSGQQTGRTTALSKRADSKYKIDRRLGVNLWGRPKSPSTSAITAPASTGRGARSRPTMASS